MPRAPRFVVLGERRTVLAPGEIRELLGRIERREGLAVGDTPDHGGAASWSDGVGGLQFPVICKPIEACGEARDGGRAFGEETEEPRGARGGFRLVDRCRRS